MKFIFILLLQSATIFSIVKSQRSSSMYNRKPVVDLKREILKATPLLPEERRKSSIFPKNTQKFVVTSPPYSKIRKYTLRPIYMTKKIFEPVYKPSISRKEPVTQSTLLRPFDLDFHKPTKVSASRIHTVFKEKNKGRYKIPRNRYIEKEIQIEDDSEEISTDLPEFSDELAKEHHNNILVDFNALSEIESAEIKKPVAHNPASVHDSWYFKNIARVPNDNSHFDYDKDEFIFLENKKKQSGLSNKLPSRKSTEHKTSRLKRSDNVIEEELRVTTDSRFTIGPESRLSSDLVFKNIHA